MVGLNVSRFSSVYTFQFYKEIFAPPLYQALKTPKSLLNLIVKCT